MRGEGVVGVAMMGRALCLARPESDDSLSDARTLAFDRRGIADLVDEATLAGTLSAAGARFWWALGLRNCCNYLVCETGGLIAGTRELFRPIMPSWTRGAVVTAVEGVERWQRR
jgi:hypothetical protein